MKSYRTYFRTNINFVHYKQSIIEFFSLNKWLLQIYALTVVAKSMTERGNSNNEHMANSSTPLIRAFFVRSIRTPKENRMQIRIVAFLSMVGRIGQRLIVGCFPCVAVFHPDTFYRQAWKLAVVPEKFHMELLAMIYKFLLTGSSRLKITVHANNTTEALSRIQFTSKPLLIARLHNSLVNNSQNMTACEEVYYA